MWKQRKKIAEHRKFQRNKMYNEKNQFEKQNSKFQQRIEKHLISFLTHPKTYEDNDRIWEKNIDKALTLKIDSKEPNFLNNRKLSLEIHLAFFHSSVEMKYDVRALTDDSHVCFSFHRTLPAHLTILKPIYFIKLPHIAELLLGVRFRGPFEAYKKLTGQ